MRKIIWIGFMLSMTGCVQGPAGAVKHASQRVERSLDASVVAMYSSPLSVRMRLNPSECDPMLKYEMEYAGAWRHVAIEDGGEALEKVCEGKCMREGEIFEVNALFLSERYQATCGQLFYTLRIE